MRQTILLADDSSTIQRLVTQTFADTRFDIVSVSNGDAAIRKFEEIHPSLVLADIYMPGKNGYEVCAHVKSHSTLSETPVILLVGAFDAFDEGTATHAGAASHITKPFEPRALIELVKSFLTETEGAEPKPRKIPVKEPEHAFVPKSSDAAPSIEMVAERRVAGTDASDILGLKQLFQPEVVKVPADVSAKLSVEEVDRIAERVIQKLSAQVVESIAWDVVPDIAVRILREELNKTTHEG